MTDQRSYIQQALADDSPAVAEARGHNVITPPAPTPWWREYLDKFRDPLMIVLLVIFILSSAISVYEVAELGHSLMTLLEPAGVLVALLLATGVAFAFERKAAREFDVLNKVKDEREVKVYRRATTDAEPHLRTVERRDVATGDIVSLEGGDEIPADGDLLCGTDPRVDESNFTGEPYANKYAVGDPRHDKAAATSTFAPHTLLRGSTLIEGNALMKVTATGDDTEEGHGAAAVNQALDNAPQTPLSRQLDSLGKALSVAAFVVAGLIIVGRMVYFFCFDGNSDNNDDFASIADFMLKSLMIAVALIAVAVPEGLPMSITLSLAMSMRKMMKTNNLVRRLHACETMGAATVICTDKTGTLTRNEMTVVDSLFGDETAQKDTIANAAVNSTAEISYDSADNLHGRPRCIGNPTEGALLAWLHSENIDYTAMRAGATVTGRTPFSSETKQMSTTVTLPSGGTRSYLKGAPEKLMSIPGLIYAGTRAANDYAAALAQYQGKAMRTLAFAHYDSDAAGNDTAVIFDGIVGIADPVRDDVAEAISTCTTRAGIRVIIVTGDTPGTALEIGRQVGLITDGDNSRSVTGAEFAAMTDDEALALLADTDFKLISRARPDDKARLVELLQRQGHVVAVTGDGTNDAPALSKAQVGLSMGDGTARAKEASDITIIDNSFASINRAIVWGRSLYQNIRRFIIFQMTINLCACLIVLVGAFIGIDSPLTVTQMLWVNLIMDTFAAMALSALPPDRRVLDAAPRSPHANIIDRDMARRMIAMGLTLFVLLLGLWQLLWHSDIQAAGGVREMLTAETARNYITGFFSFEKSKAHISTYELGIFFTIFVMMQFWNLFNARYYNTGRSLLSDLVNRIAGKRPHTPAFGKGFIAIASGILIGQFIIVNYCGAMFGVSALPLTDWAWIMVVTSPVLIVPELIRNIRIASSKC